MTALPIIVIAILILSVSITLFLRKNVEVKDICDDDACCKKDE